jgi:hypothetical protein
MKSNELRIGNWIKLEKNVYQVEMNDSCGVVGIDKIGLVRLEKCEPIPLTEEWLSKFGFTNEKQGYKHWNLDLYFHKDGEWFESDQLPMFIFLQYVHQLQNLYFASTGAELILKP